MELTGSVSLIRGGASAPELRSRLARQLERLGASVCLDAADAPEYLFELFTDDGARDSSAPPRAIAQAISGVAALPERLKHICLIVAARDGARSRAIADGLAYAARQRGIGL